jgi:hypothetical protein
VGCYFISNDVTRIFLSFLTLIPLSHRVFQFHFGRRLWRPPRTVLAALAQALAVAQCAVIVDFVTAG